MQDPHLGTIWFRDTISRQYVRTREMGLFEQIRKTRLDYLPAQRTSQARSNNAKWEFKMNMKRYVNVGL